MAFGSLHRGMGFAISPRPPASSRNGNRRIPTQRP